MRAAQFPDEGSDTLHEVLRYVPDKQRRVIGRSLSKRHHAETEHLIAKEVLAKPVTDQELEKYCLAEKPKFVVMQASSVYTHCSDLTITDEYYVLKINNKSIEGYWEFGFEQRKNGLSIQEGIGSAFEGEDISTLISNAKQTFEGYRYGKMRSIPDDYQPEPTVTPDVEVLYWVYRRRLKKLSIHVSYADDVLEKYEQLERHALYLIAQCIAGELLDPKEYFRGGIPTLDEQLIKKLEQMLL